MNLRIDRPVLLRVHCPRASEGLRERLLTALVAHFDIVAIYELEDQDGICVQVSLGEHAWPSQQDEDDGYSAFGRFEDVVAPLDVKWRHYPSLTSLITAHAGHALEVWFGREGVRCDLWLTHEWGAPSIPDTIQVGRFVVTPPWPWEIPEIEPGQILIKIEPSMGFGTGQHPSTRLALAFLQRVSCSDRDVLDVGTGSGILAIAAATLGARRVLAIDCDRDALSAADISIGRNSQRKRIELRMADVSTDLVGQFDLVLANLDGDQLQSWASQLMSHVRPGGQLLVSGFLAAEADLVRRALPMREFLQEAEWCAGIVEG
jgi:ribosomal protein L11 methyltransferase